MQWVGGLNPCPGIRLVRIPLNAVKTNSSPQKDLRITAFLTKIHRQSSNLDGRIAKAIPLFVTLLLNFLKHFSNKIPQINKKNCKLFTPAANNSSV